MPVLTIVSTQQRLRKPFCRVSEINRDVAGHKASFSRSRIIILPGINLRLVTLVRAGLISPDRSRSSLGRWYYSSLINGGYPAGPRILSPSLSLSPRGKWGEVNHLVSQREREFYFLARLLKNCRNLSFSNNNSRLLFRGYFTFSAYRKLRSIIIFHAEWRLFPSTLARSDWITIL